MHFDFFARFILIIQACFFYAFSLSLAYARQLPPGGSLSRKHVLRLSFVCFIIIGRAFFELRDYRVVFFIQKAAEAKFRLCRKLLIT